MHHTKRGSRERLNLGVLEDGVCLSDTHTLDGAGWWGLLSLVWVQTACTDDRGWVNVFLKGRADRSSHSFPAFAGVGLLPRWSWKCLSKRRTRVIYQCPGCDVGRTKCKLSAHVESSLETVRKEAKRRYHQVVTSTGGLELEYKTVRRVSDFCLSLGGKYRNVLALSGRSKQTRTDEIKLDKTGGEGKRREEK